MMLLVLVMSILWICSSDQTYLNSVGASLIGLLREHSPKVSSVYFIFLLHCIALAFIITYNIETWRGLVGQIVGVSTTVLLNCMYMGLAYPFYNPCVFGIFVLYEFAIYGTFMGMALYRIYNQDEDGLYTKVEVNVENVDKDRDGVWDWI